MKITRRRLRSLIKEELTRIVEQTNGFDADGDGVPDYRDWDPNDPNIQYPPEYTGAHVYESEPVPVTMGRYCVKEGDTLSGITALYSPREIDWQMNHDINPGISNPDMIRPGQHIEIYLDPDITADEWLRVAPCGPASMSTDMPRVNPDLRLPAMDL